MNILKIKYILSALTAIMLLMTGSLSATHLVGGQLTYRCLGNNQYEVTLVVRRDCINGADDAPFDDPATVGIFDGFGFLNIAIGDNGRLEMPLTNVTLVNNSLSADCQLNPDDGLLCVEEAVYTGTVTLPPNKTGYTLAYQRCCRNVILDNINDPLETGVTYFSHVTPFALQECNSQPVFNDFPEIYICAGEKFVFNHTAVDPDGDELRYRFCIPSAGATIDNPNPQVPSTPPFPTVSWANGFSEDNVFGSGGTITIDENTGMTMGTPEILGTYLIGVCVDEYRDGVLISTTRRDFEYNVVICSPPIVIDCELRGNDCDGDNTISFVNRTTGADRYMWHFDFPNTDPSTTSTIPSPTHTYPGPGKYIVRKEAIRDFDGCSVFEEFVVSTGPSMLEPDFIAEFISCDGQNLVGLTDLSVDPTGISCAVAWEWTINLNGNPIVLEGNPASFDAGTATTAEITLEVTSSSGCVNTITRTIDLTDLFPSSSIQTILLDCDNGFNLQLLNSSNSSFANLTGTTWTITQDGLTTNPTGNPITVNTQGGDLTITVASTYDNGCVSEFTTILDQSQYQPVIDIVNSGGAGSCVSSAVYTFSPSISGVMVAAPITSYLWTDTNGNTFNTENIDIELNPGETIGLELVVTYGNGCVFSSNDNNSIGGPFTFTAAIAPQLTITPVVDCNSTSASTNVVLTDNTIFNSAISSQIWTINGVPQTAGSSLSFPVGIADVVVTYDVTYANGCTASYTETFNRNSLIPTDQDAAAINSDILSCNGDEITISISGGANSANFTETWVINGMTFNTSPVTITVGLNDQVNIQHTLVSAVGCENSAQQSYVAESLIPAVVITSDLDAIDCVDPNGQVISISSGVVGTSYAWIIDGVAFNTANPQITVLPGQTISASVDVVLPTGCNTSGSGTLTASNAGGGDPITITSDLDGVDCINASGQVVTFTTGITGSSFAWNIDGVAFTTANPQITVLPGQTVMASVEVILPTGCISTGSTTFTATNNTGGGPVTITNNRGTETPCVGPGGETLVISANGSGQINSYEWICTLDGNAIPTSSDPSISVSIQPGQQLVCTVNVVYDNGCTATSTTQIFTQSGDQELDVVESVDCTDPSAPNITLNYQQSLGGASATAFTWNVNGVISNDASVTFPLSAMTGLVNVSLTVEFDNGCTSTFTDSYDPGLLTPNVDYTATPIECIDGQILYEFMLNDGELLCITLESLVWTINGQTFTGNPVQVLLPANTIIDDISVIATYSDGSIFGEGITLPPLNTGDGITNDNIAVMQVASGGDAECNGDVELEVVNPDDNLTYVWTDAEGNPVGMGPSIMTNTGIAGDIIMVNYFDNPNCIIGTGTIVVEDISISLNIDSLYVICPGDTTNIYCITSTNLDQTITYNWKPADQLIGGEDQSCPTIGVPEDQTEDFSLILCTTNNFGCERSDTIDFMVSTPVDGAISFAPDSCGSLTYNFMSPEGVFLEGLMWDFGDGNTSTDPNPTHTYNEEGEFTVTLDSDGVCLGDIPPVTLAAPAFPILNIAVDTLIYTFGDTVEVLAATNAKPAIISWCNMNGAIIGMGNPLVYVPETDPETITAKVEDQFGCTSQTEVVLMSNTSLPPVTTTSPEIACIDEEFVVSLDIGDANPADFTFDWQPANCIVEGQGTQQISAATSESKTFSVVMTNTETNQDTTIMVDVQIENTPIGIFADNGIPGQGGEPTVCQGSEINLSAEPFDADCDYEWSTGENGETIIVAPEENTTYSLSCVTANGCEFSASTDIEVTPPQCNEEDVFVPNAFSPNNDNVNDRLFVRSKFIREMEFFVVDRWGEEVWRTTDQNQGWDGQFEGEALAPDTYAYCLIVTCVNEQTYTTRGNVSILK